MLKNKIIITLAIISLSVLTATTIASAVMTVETPSEEAENVNYGGSATATSRPSSNVNFRTCFNDRDIGGLLLEAKNSNQHWLKDDRAPACDHIQYQCLFSARVDCIETPQGYSWKCINYSYDYDGNGWFKEGTRDIEGAQQSNCSIPKKRLDGKCSLTRNTCEKGMLDNVASSTEEYMWTCFGEGGGNNEQCSEAIPQVVNGDCGSKEETCKKGKVFDIAPTPTEWKWTCKGENKGTDKACTKIKPFKGECGLTENTCVKGTSTKQLKYTERFVWACEGVGSGSTASCSKNRVEPGKCSVNLNKCDEGTASDFKKTATANTWICNGVGGAANVDCSKKFSAQDGVCSSSHFRCAVGEGTSSITTTDVWSWVCPGLFGGKSASCFESMGVKKGSCSVTKNKCNVGTPTAMTEDTAVYKWTCLGPNKGGDVNCESKKKVEGVCSETKDTCVSGDLLLKKESRTMFNWGCKGIAGGSSESCSFPKSPTATTTGVCAKDHYACLEGLAVNKKESKTSFTWACNGNAGGKNSNCIEIKPINEIESPTSTATTTSGTENKEEKGCSMLDVKCLEQQCGGDVACKETIDKCVSGKIKCVVDFKIVPGLKEPYGKGVCALNDRKCINEGCDSIACTRTIEECSDGKISCVKNLTIDKEASMSKKVCPLLDSKCIKQQCEGDGACERTVDECVAGKVKCVRNFKIIPGAKAPYETGDCSLNDQACLEEGCNNLSCKTTIKECSEGKISCVKNLSIDKDAASKSNKEKKDCLMTDYVCLIKQCGGNLVCEDTIKKCVKGEVKCVDNFKIIPGVKGPFKEGTCALNDVACVTKQCGGNLVCEDTIKNCSNGNATCVKDLIIDKGTVIKGNNDACALDDTDCLLKKCNGNAACIAALKKCKANDATCIEDALRNAGTSITGPVLQNSPNCSPKDLQCLLRKCNGNLACESALRKCKLTDTKCVNAALLKRNPGWGPSFKENNGTCGTEMFSCVYGTNYDNIRDIDSYKWSCVGKHGGNNAACISLKPKDAVCSTKTHNTCEVGKPSTFSETATTWSWKCGGIGAGKATPCSMNIVPLDGVCGDKNGSCSVGNSSGYKLIGEWNEWTCAGTYGGKDTPCFREVRGSCSIARYSCDAGVPESKMETNDGYSWKCRGANGDLTVGCFEKKTTTIQNNSTSSGATSSTQIKTNLGKVISSTMLLINSKMKLLGMTVDNLFALM